MDFNMDVINRGYAAAQRFCEVESDVSNPTIVLYNKFDNIGTFELVHNSKFEPIYSTLLADRFEAVFVTEKGDRIPCFISFEKSKKK